MPIPEHLTLPKRRCWISLPQPPEQLPYEVAVGDKFTVDHLSKVLRLKTGETVLAIDEHREFGYIAAIGEIQKTRVTLTLQTFIPSTEQLVPKVTLAAGLIKETHWEWMLQKATELGATEIIPLKSGFSDIQDRMVKPDRWRQIAKAAALQSERFSIPRIHPLTELSALPRLSTANSHKLLLQERAQDIPSLPAHLQGIEPSTPLIVAVGPEGGWQTGEIQFLQQQGFQPVSLGPQVLRADTAALAALSCILCR